MGRGGRLTRGIAGAIAGVTAALAVPATASGPGETAPWYLDQFGGDRADLLRLYDGHLGVVMARSPRPQLFIAWRLLHGLKVGREAGYALSVPCCDLDRPAPGIAPPQNAPATTSRLDSWLEARKLIPGAPDVGTYIATERPGPNYTDIPNCFQDAFAAAATTLKTRVAASGAASPDVKVWLLTQDAIFKACKETGVALPPLPAAAPPWLRMDRAYQEAAFDLYDGRPDRAADRFAAIAQDRASPWRSSAPYLTVRAAMRFALARKTPAAYARAHAALDTLAAAPAGSFGRGEVRDLRRVLRFREDPAGLLAQLGQELAQPAPSADIAVAFRDYSDLGDKDRAKAEALDWMATLLPSPLRRGVDASPPIDAATEARQEREARATALTHARARWATTHDEAWLIAALSLADPGGAEAGPLTADAAKVAAGRPAFLSAQFHLARLTLRSAPLPQSRARLDVVLARTNLSVSDRSVFTALRMQVAADASDFARFALRHRLCADDQGNGGCFRDRWASDSELPSSLFDGEGAKGVVGFGEDARAVIDRLPLEARIALAEDKGIPAKLQMDVALTSYVRAVALQDDAAVDRLAGLLETRLPQLAADWKAMAQARPGPDKRFAEFYVMAKIPGLRIDLVDYTRPEGKVAEFQQYWTDWIVLPKGRPSPTQAARPGLTYQNAGYTHGVDSEARTDLACLGECGRGASPLRLPDFAAAGQAKARAERGYFFRSEAVGEKPKPAVPAGGVAAWDEMLTYLAAHPADARAPEALYWLVHVGRFGGSHDHSGRRAFKVLKAKYAASSWAKKTPYFYD